jgi:hypothetical protein
VRLRSEDPLERESAATQLVARDVLPQLPTSVVSSAFNSQCVSLILDRIHGCWGRERRATWRGESESAIDDEAAWVLHLGAMAHADDRVISYLIGNLSRDGWYEEVLRNRSAQALAGIYLRTKDACIIEAFRAFHKDYPNAASDTLETILERTLDTPQVLELLSKMDPSDETSLRQRYYECGGSWVEKELLSEQADDRLGAVWAIDVLGDNPEGAKRHLVQALLYDEDAEVRLLSASQLGEFLSDNRVLAILRQVCDKSREPHEPVRRTAAELLKKAANAGE